jgi:hypothetical protein
VEIYCCYLNKKVAQLLFRRAPSTLLAPLCVFDPVTSSHLLPHLLYPVASHDLRAPGTGYHVLVHYTDANARGPADSFCVFLFNTIVTGDTNALVYLTITILIMSSRDAHQTSTTLPSTTPNTAAGGSTSCRARTARLKHAPESQRRTKGRLPEP